MRFDSRRSKMDDDASSAEAAKLFTVLREPRVYVVRVYVRLGNNLPFIPSHSHPTVHTLLFTPNHSHPTIHAQP
jgi:hypothetical protein